MEVTGRRQWLVRLAGVVPALLLAPRASGAGILQRTTKPSLEDQPFNARYVPLKGTPQYARELRAAQADLVAYLDQHFDLTPAQRRAVAAFPKKSIQELNAGLERAIQENLALVIRGAKRDRCGDIKATVEGTTLVVQILS